MSAKGLKITHTRSLDNAEVLFASSASRAKRLACSVHPACDQRQQASFFGCTGTKEIAAAKRIAAQIIESFWKRTIRGNVHSLRFIVNQLYALGA
jgi:hypothetical protein